MSWKRTLIMGHEGAGAVTACGEEVSHVAAGDYVLLNWAIPSDRSLRFFDSVVRDAAEALDA